MSNSPLFGGTTAARRAPGSEVDRLGPSDRSDSGSDSQGERPMATAPDNPAEWGAIPADGRSDSDAFGTGERSSAAGSEPRDSADIMPDRVVGGGDAEPAVVDEEVQAALDSLADEARSAADDAQDELETARDTSGSTDRPRSADRSH